MDRVAASRSFAPEASEADMDTSPPERMTTVVRRRVERRCHQAAFRRLRTWKPTPMARAASARLLALERSASARAWMVCSRVVEGAPGGRRGMTALGGGGTGDVRLDAA